MTIYVDNMFIEATVGRITSKWCHLFSDLNDTTELHAFAASIGLRRSWFQTKAGQEWGDHYDVTLGKRAAAVRRGAEEIGWHEAAEIWAGKAELLRRRVN